MSPSASAEASPPGAALLHWTRNHVDEAGGLLTAEEGLQVLTGATQALIEGDGYDAGLHVLTGLLVPRVADLAAVYVRGKDARLHPRSVTGTRDVDRAGAPGADEILERRSGHPAALASWRGRAVVLSRDGGAPEVISSGDAGDAFRRRSVRALALPLEARGETLGALYLLLAGDERTYGKRDLVLAGGLAGRAAMALDNQRLLRAAQEARRAKGDFLAVMSHELRTPLTAVVGYTDLLEEGIPGPVNEEQSVQLRRIKESAWELLELIDGILGYARFESEEPEVQKERVDISEVVDEAVSVVRSALERKGLELAVTVPPDMPPVYTDRTKLRRVLVHLLDNAVKFTASGTISLRVRRGDVWVRFEVADTGAGIEEEHQERVFEPFWQGERAETRTAGGTGMGLALARRLARVLGGEIALETEPGLGSMFTLLLPDETGEG